MITALSLDDAKDIIDIYGPDETFWPRDEIAELRQLVANNSEFRDYVEDARWLEQMLENWEEDEDGASIEMDDMDWLQQDTPPPPSPSEPDFDEADEPEHDEDEAEEEQEREEREEIEAEPIEIDPEDIQDMDSMLAKVIMKEVQTYDTDEFRVFTRDLDDVVNIQVPDNVNLEPLEQKVAKTTGPLQKDMRRLIAARSQVKRMPGMRSGRLHAPNLHRIMAGDDRVFTRREEAPSLDTAVSLVIDCSGSMNGTRMVLATETSFAVGSVLARLNVAFECLGFTDNGEDPRISTKEYKTAVAEADAIAKIIRHIPIVMPKFKTFEERWTQPVQRRFAHVFNSRGYSGDCGFRMGSTPEGCGIEFAARRLLARPEQRKIMLVMTDGEPCGAVYNPRSHEDYYAYGRQSEAMVKSISAAGIDLVGIGIQHDGPEGYYPHHMTIQNVEEMPKQLLQLLKKFMTGK